MTETSTRRRIAGRFMLGAAIIALPLTASITYAESIASAPPAAPTAPIAPAAPPAPGAIPAPPLPPVPPAPPAPFAAAGISSFDPDMDVDVEVTKKGDENVFVYRSVDEDDDGKVKTKVKTLKVKNTGEKMSQEEMDALMAELRADLADADIDIKNAMKEVEMAFVELDKTRGEQGRTIVKMQCRGDGDDVATVEESDGEVRKVFICQSKVMAHALKGLKEARKAIADNPEIDGEMRKNVLREIDQQIKNWNKENG